MAKEAGGRTAETSWRPRLPQCAAHRMLELDQCSHCPNLGIVGHLFTLVDPREGHLVPFQPLAQIVR